MSDYRARVIRDPARGWQHYDRVSIGVSMGNPSTDGAKFRALVDLVNAQPNFRSCLICVSDTLSRWNAIDGEGRVLPDAEERARAQGSAWLGRNAVEVARLAVPHEVVRWDRWRHDPAFPQVLDQVERLYRERPAFRAAIDEDAAEVVARRKAGGMPGTTGRLLENSHRFFIEEIAGYSLFYRHYPRSAKIYPGSQIRSFLVGDGATLGLDQEYFMQAHIRRVGGRPDRRSSGPLVA